jgi:Na+/H+ antiporter NhaC
MAKRQPKQKKQEEALEKRKVLIVRILWVFVVIVCLLFGYSYGYPIVAQGQVAKGFLIGLVYGGGAFLAILVSYFLNQKLKGY